LFFLVPTRSLEIFYKRAGDDRQPTAGNALDVLLAVLIAALLATARITLALVLLSALSGLVALLLLPGLRVLALIALVLVGILIHIAHVETPALVTTKVSIDP
jgi:hypothetical protein